MPRLLGNVFEPNFVERAAARDTWQGIYRRYPDGRSCERALPNYLSRTPLLQRSDMRDCTRLRETRDGSTALKIAMNTSSIVAGSGTAGESCEAPLPEVLPNRARHAA